MQRVIVAVVLLALIVGVCVWTQQSEIAAIDDLLGRLNAAEAAFRRGDTASALTITQELVKVFDERTRWFPFFLNHAEVTETERCAVGLPWVLDGGEPKDFLPEVYRCRLLLRRLRERAVPSPENIL